MNLEFAFRLDRTYMSESYDQARLYGSKWLLAEKAIGAILIVVGIALFVYSRGETALPAVLIAIGAFELLSNRIKKHFWLRRHLRSKLNDADVQITLSDSGIASKSPYSTSEMKWSGVEKVVRTPKGILIWPQKGVYWYLPASTAGTEAIAFIETKSPKKRAQLD